MSPSTKAAKCPQCRQLMGDPRRHQCTESFEDLQPTTLKLGRQRGFGRKSAVSQPSTLTGNVNLQPDPETFESVPSSSRASTQPHRTASPAPESSSPGHAMATSSAHEAPEQEPAGKSIATLGGQSKVSLNGATSTQKKKPDGTAHKTSTTPQPGTQKTKNIPETSPDASTKKSGSHKSETKKPRKKDNVPDVLPKIQQPATAPAELTSLIMPPAFTLPALPPLRTSKKRIADPKPVAVADIPVAVADIPVPVADIPVAVADIPVPVAKIPVPVAEIPVPVTDASVPISPQKNSSRRTPKQYLAVLPLFLAVSIGLYHWQLASSTARLHLDIAGPKLPNINYAAGQEALYQANFETHTELSNSYAELGRKVTRHSDMDPLLQVSLWNLLEAVPLNKIDCSLPTKHIQSHLAAAVEASTTSARAWPRMYELCSQVHVGLRNSHKVLAQAGDESPLRHYVRIVFPSRTSSEDVKQESQKLLREKLDNQALSELSNVVAPLCDAIKQTSKHYSAIHKKLLKLRVQVDHASQALPQSWYQSFRNYVSNKVPWMQISCDTKAVQIVQGSMSEIVHLVATNSTEARRFINRRT